MLSGSRPTTGLAQAGTRSGGVLHEYRGRDDQALNLNRGEGRLKGDNQREIKGEDTGTSCLGSVGEEGSKRLSCFWFSYGSE